MKSSHCVLCDYLEIFLLFFEGMDDIIYPQGLDISWIVTE